MNVLVFKDFLKQNECCELNTWVEYAVKNKYLDCGISRGSGWEYKNRLTTRNYGDRFNYPKIVYNVFQRITEFLSIQHLHKSVVGGGKDGVVVSYTLPGGDVYLHKDPMEGTKHVLRCNVMTQSADDGAELFIGNKKIDIEVGDLHCYLPSYLTHYVTEVKGNTPRIMWMFGYQSSIQEFENIRSNHG